MAWGSVELEPEVVEWLKGLPDEQFGRVEFYIDLLADRGAQLGEPYTRQLQGKLRELRFYLGPQSDAVRITYYIVTGRRIILLTVFRKQRQRERAEIDRAVRAMEKCIAEGTQWRTNMTEMASLSELKSRRGDSEGRRRGYQDAKVAFELGARVRAERERLNLTQSELAEKMGTTQPTIARLEAGGVTPSLDTLHRAADALGLELVVDFREAASA